MDPHLSEYALRNRNYSGNRNEIMYREGILMRDDYGEQGNYDYDYDYEDEFEYEAEGSEILENEFDNRNNETYQRDVICCPMEMLHNRRHLQSYKHGGKDCNKKSDLSRIPKFRNPWVVHNEFKSKLSKDIPLTFEEAQTIREIWQDTRAQYNPSDGEIEKEYLFEEEYDDLNAERRRMNIIEKGATLVRYSRHYELPTISTIIKSSNPEQFRSRSLSPFISNARGEGVDFKRRGNRRSSNDVCYNERSEYYSGTEEEYNDINNDEYSCGDVRKVICGSNNQYQVNNAIKKRDGRFNHSNVLTPLREKSNESRVENVNKTSVNSINEYNQSVCGDKVTLNVPSFSDMNNLGIHRNTVQGISSEYGHLTTNNSAGVHSRRATSPELLSPSKNTSRGPPPKIGVLEPIETTGGLVSPVNQPRTPILSTPRIGTATPRLKSRHSRTPSNNNYVESAPVVSPSAKQTIVFHMLPDSDNNNSKATIFANPDTHNVVTELHITPGVDINVISTPTGPAIEYEISGGRNAKAHINFSSNPNTDKLMKSSEIPKINLPESTSDDSTEFKTCRNAVSKHMKQSNVHVDLSPTPKGIRSSSLEDSNNSARSRMGNHGRLNDINGANHSNNEYSQATCENNAMLQTSPVTHSSINQANYKGEKNYMGNDLTIRDTFNSKNGNIKEKMDDHMFNEAIDIDGNGGSEEVIDEEQKNLDTFYNGNNDYNNIIKSHPNPFVPVRRIQKRTGFTGCIIDTLTCTKADTAELKTFRALNPVEVVHRSP